MANDKFYGYSPKNEKPSKTQGQIYSGAEKSTRKGQVTHGTYANIGNRLDRVNPYEFKKGMDYELVQMGVSRLAESTVEEREKATESVLKNLEGKHPAYYSALIQFERGMGQGGQIKETTFNKYLETFSRGHGDGMMSVEKEFKDDKMVELKEAIKAQIRTALLSEQKDVDEEDEDVTAKKATRGAKRASKKAARFDQEIAAIEELLFGKNNKNPEATAPPPPPEGLPPPPPPATTIYSNTSEPDGEPAEVTVKVPGPVKVCILKSPQQVTVPPVAEIKSLPILAKSLS